ncbi:MAG TPA: ScpA family protein [Chloroflexota bacterium]
MELPEFSGPLDLLLTLIQKRRLDVTAVSLAAVADQYLEQVLALEGELDALSEFLVLASQLLVIKSRALLPGLAPPDAEPDVAEDLERRLAEYQVLQGAARWLGDREAAGLRSWQRGGELPTPAGVSVLAPITAAALARLVAERLRRRHPERTTATLEVPCRPSLQERAHLVLRAVGDREWHGLDDLLGPDVPSAVATFLAVLVLVRRGLLRARQEGPRAALEIRHVGTGPVELAGLELAE